MHCTSRRRTFLSPRFDTQQVGPTAGTVLAGYQSNCGREVSATAELLTVSHLCRQQTRRDQANARDGQQARAEVIFGKLLGHFPVQFLDLFIQVAEVLVQSTQQCNQSRRYLMHRYNWIRPHQFNDGLPPAVAEEKLNSLSGRG